MITEKVGNRIRLIRKEKKYSQENLALKAGVDRTYLAGVESGKRNISIRNLEKIIHALDISIESFFKGFK